MTHASMTMMAGGHHAVPQTASRESFLVPPIDICSLASVGMDVPNQGMDAIKLIMLFALTVEVEEHESRHMNQ